MTSVKMSKVELKNIMTEIHQAEMDALNEADERDHALRLLVHDNIGSFLSWWDVLDFCRQTTKTELEYRAVARRMLKTWKNHKYGVIA